MSEVKPEKQVRAQIKQPDRNMNTPSSKSSKWETPISDTQAVASSDDLLTEQEAHMFFDDEEVHTPNTGITEGASGQVEAEPARSLATRSWYHS